MAEIEKKMRIQLFDPDFNMLSDRLVTQETEFSKGPKEVHGGPLKVEFALFTKEDIADCKEYLDRLTGGLPLDIPLKKRGRKKLSISSPNYREILLESVQEFTEGSALVTYLREEGFVFTTLEYLEDLGNPIAVSSRHRRSYKWLVRLIKQAKNPLNDKYDLSVLFGFRDNTLIIYSGDEVVLKRALDNSIETEIRIPVKFKVKFPVYMQHDERAQFRIQVEILKKDPEAKPTRLYKRWLSEVMRSSPLEIQFPRADQIQDPYDTEKTVAEVQTLLSDKAEIKTLSLDK